MANQFPYSNFVIEDLIKSYINTKLGMSRFLTVDESLVGTDGLKAVIHRYTGVGGAEDLTKGNKNTSEVDAAWTSEEYTASRHQATTSYTDDDNFEDSAWVNAKIQYLGESMISDYNSKAVGEMAKTENIVEVSDWSFDAFADAVGRYAEEHEVEDGLQFVVDIKLVPAIRKKLRDSLQYSEAYVRQGALGTVCGVPVFPTKLLAGKGVGYLVNAEAIRDFVKSNVRVEQTRDIERKKNTIVADRYDIIALFDETKCIQVGEALEHPATITTYTKNAKIIAGAAETGATVTAYVNGEKTGSSVIASTNAYSITATENLEPGDIVKVVADLDGYAKSIATVEVAE